MQKDNKPNVAISNRKNLGRKFVRKVKKNIARERERLEEKLHLTFPLTLSQQKGKSNKSLSRQDW
jgi:CHASE1-domain containing sensor protein